MRTSVYLRCLLVCLSLIGCSLVVASRPTLADDDATEQARKHYQEAQKQFDLGMWEVAISEFAKAYELRPDPSFLFNMAQAYRRAGNARRAIDLYKNYLIKVPKSPQRAEVEERIQSLQRQLDEEEREAKRIPPAPKPPLSTLTPEPATSPGDLPEPSPAAATAPEAPTAAAVTDEPVDGAAVAPSPSPAAASPPTDASESIAKPAPAALPAAPAATTAARTLPTQDPGSRSLRIAGLLTGAAGLAGVGAGIVFSVRAKSLSDSISNAAQFNSSDAHAGRQAAMLQWVCYGAGGAALLTGALFYWQGRAKKGKATVVSFVPVLAPTAVGLMATGAL